MLDLLILILLPGLIYKTIRLHYKLGKDIKIFPGGKVGLKGNMIFVPFLFFLLPVLINFYIDLFAFDYSLSGLQYVIWFGTMSAVSLVAIYLMPDPKVQRRTNSDPEFAPFYYNDEGFIADTFFLAFMVLPFYYRMPYYEWSEIKEIKEKKLKSVIFTKVEIVTEKKTINFKMVCAQTYPRENSRCNK